MAYQMIFRELDGQYRNHEALNLDDALKDARHYGYVGDVLICMVLV